MKKILGLSLIFLIITSFAFASAEEKFNSSNLLFQQKKYKEADKILQQAITDYPLEINIAKLYANNLFALGKYKESFAFLEKKIIVDNKYTTTDRELYELQIKNINQMIQKKITIDKINLEEELAIYTEIFNTFDRLTDSDEIYQKGNEYIKARDYKNALRIFEMETNGDIRNLFGAGLTSKFLGLLPQSIDYFNKIIEIDPTFTRAYKEVAMAYQVNKDYEKAIENFKIYLSTIPEERTYLVVANIYIGNYKDYEKAREILLEAITAFPDSKAIGDLLKTANKKLGINE